ncbi:hypothetical protein EGR_08955 [Echinococcus granulosus]|uniref:Uncharacterized protein n=1 Tax=Echinococcus granulosus TaxID=6210 RepID=W6UD24_ECHGR|nr:hypothetical protein EGR_08955 [Echinococcus granulosus]EUB56207.1 hypothetical protein EGR_08955 [Echinococcus granulosus]
MKVHMARDSFFHDFVEILLLQIFLKKDEANFAKSGWKEKKKEEFYFILRIGNALGYLAFIADFEKQPNKCENGDSDVTNTFLKQAQTLAIILTFISNAFNFASTFTFIRRIYPSCNSYAFTSAFRRNWCILNYIVLTMVHFLWISQMMIKLSPLKQFCQTFLTKWFFQALPEIHLIQRSFANRLSPPLQIHPVALWSTNPALLTLNTSVAWVDNFWRIVVMYNIKETVWRLFDGANTNIINSQSFTSFPSRLLPFTLGNPIKTLLRGKATIRSYAIY